MVTVGKCYINCTVSHFISKALAVVSNTVKQPLRCKVDDPGKFA